MNLLGVQFYMRLNGEKMTERTKLVQKISEAFNVRNIKNGFIFSVDHNIPGYLPVECKFTITTSFEVYEKDIITSTTVYLIANDILVISGTININNWLGKEAALIWETLKEIYETELSVDKKNIFKLFGV